MTHVPDFPEGGDMIVKVRLLVNSLFERRLDKLFVDVMRSLPSISVKMLKYTLIEAFRTSFLQ